MTKICGACKKEMPVECFSKSRGNSGGLYSYCRACASTRYRAYYAAHRARRLEYARLYRGVNRGAILARELQYRRQNREARSAYRKQWGEVNRVSRAEYERSYRQRKIELQSLRRSLSPGARRAENAQQRAKRRLVGGTFTGSDWRELVKRSPICFWCKRKFGKDVKPTHDHVVPLSRGGFNSPENSVAACKSCNSRKGTGIFDPVSGQGILI